MAFNWINDVFARMGWSIDPDPRKSPGPYHFVNTGGEWLVLDISDTQNGIRLVTKDHKTEVFVPIAQCTFKRK